MGHHWSRRAGEQGLNLRDAWNSKISVPCIRSHTASRGNHGAFRSTRRLGYIPYYRRPMSLVHQFSLRVLLLDSYLSRLIAPASLRSAFIISRVQLLFCILTRVSRLNKKARRSCTMQAAYYRALLCTDVIFSRLKLAVDMKLLLYSVLISIAQAPQHSACPLTGADLNSTRAHFHDMDIGPVVHHR